MRLGLRRHMKTPAWPQKQLELPGHSREQASADSSTGFPACHPVPSRGGQSEQAFLEKDGATWSGVSFKSVKTFSNVRWLVWGLQFIPESTFLPSAVLGSKILSAGISPQGTRTCYVPQLLHRHLESAGGNPSVWRIWSNKIKSLVYIQGSAGWLNICHEHIKLPPLGRETLTYGIWIYSLLI